MLRELATWSLVFSQVITYWEVWGVRPRGMTKRDEMEVHMAWDEHQRLTKAEESVKKTAGQESEFDLVAWRMKYLEDRLADIENRRV